MTPANRAETLKKAIEIAVKNGWGKGGYDWILNEGVVMNGQYPYEPIIFDHEFAKALWGNGVTRVETTKGTVDYSYDNMPEGGIIKFDGGLIAITIHKKGWKEHLKAMVIADDPIEYLANWLKEQNV